MRDPSTMADGGSGKPGHPLQLVVLTGGGVTTHALPNGASLTLGRGDAADVRVEDPRVSRLHVRLHVADNIEVEDLGASNGTFVRGERLVPHRRVEVAPAEAISFGGAIAIVQPRYQAAQSAEPGSVRAPAAPGPAGAAPLDIVVEDEGMKRLYELARRAARSSINVLLLGETGVGKEVFAEAIHGCSERHREPLVCINCAALAEQLLESELFGFERGAFTGAVSAKPGLLESAGRGTVFLDEIGELGAATQAKLLRVLETKQVTRLGSVKGRYIDVRFVSATHRDLAADVERGAFRRDLYFRLNGLSLRIPALRDRPGEIAPLAAGFARAAASARHIAEPSISERAMRRLAAYSWPGNIRELRNVMERAILLSDGPLIDTEHLLLEQDTPAQPGATKPRATQPAPNIAGQSDVRDELSVLEQRRIIEALELFGGNQTRAARHIGMPRRTFLKRLDAYGVHRPRRSSDKG